MAAKRKRDADSAGTEDTRQEQKAKKSKKGFSVGPDNLPEGTHKKKVQKIKRDLIEKAKTKKEYARLKQKLLEEQGDTPKPQDGQDTSMHPERAARLEEEPPGLRPNNSVLERTGKDPEVEATAEADNPKDEEQKPLRRDDHKRRKPTRFTKEQAIAAQRKEEAEARRQAKADAQRQREEKQAERERYRRAMAKAKGAGKNGQRKLGRESGVLLEKVRRMMAG